MYSRNENILMSCMGVAIGDFNNDTPASPCKYVLQSASVAESLANDSANRHWRQLEETRSRKGPGLPKGKERRDRARRLDDLYANPAEAPTNFALPPIVRM
jgi:hypothetical protein